MSHANARLTPAGRFVMVQRIGAGRPVAHVAAEMGISRTTAWRWWHRFQAEGRAGLVDRPSVALTHPARTAMHIILILQDLGRVTTQLGHLLQTGVGATDPMLGAARELIDLASRQRWDEAKRAVLDLCDPVPEAPDETGQPGAAMQGLLLGLLYREFGSGA